MKLKSHQWHKTAMAAAAAALMGLSASSTLALSLGPIVVQSALGEPLRAEIDVPEINAEEAASLKASIASPDAFRAAGLEYNAAMASLRASLQRRPDGRAFIRLVSDRPVNEPFVDLILEASWSSGRIVRDYTMLFDPPNLRSPAAPAMAALPQVSAPQANAPAASSQAVASQPSQTPARPIAAARKPAAVSPPTSTPAPIQAPAGDRQITVKPGSTASRIAAANKPANVSLDQMLVALLRSNPDAFINNNINRIKSGAVMNMPSAEQALAVSAVEATQTVIAQSKDFNEFRNKLAGSAPKTQVAAADRQSSGSVQAKVEDKKPGTVAPDKLTLSKGAVQAQAADAEKIARERAAKEASDKASELSKNISDLAKIGAASSAVASAPAAKPASAPTIPVAAIPAAAASAEKPASAPVAPAAPVVAASPPPPIKAPVPAPVQEPSMVDQLLENPLVPAGAAGLVALLAGFGVYRARQRKKSGEVDSAFLESRLQPDSFFGASGGQRVDTNDGNATGSSMVYSPSQLDAADDVDPVAEADVYLAYGRDLQAEEILKEALKTNAGRIAIHHKLLEIYAKRRDAKSFERVANDAFKLTNVEGPDWQRVCELGLSFDPTNALYQPGGEPSGNGVLSAPAPLEATSTYMDSTVPQHVAQSAAATPSDMDLDLDFSLDEENSSAITDMRSTEQTTRLPIAQSNPLPLDMDLALPDEPVTASGNEIEFDLPQIDTIVRAPDPLPGDIEDFSRQAAVSFGSTSPAPLAQDAAKPPLVPIEESGMLEFDLGSLSLDLGDSTEGTSAAPTAVTPEDPLATKLALAEEFSAIGDDDGARALIEEVISEAAGDMKTRAQQALTKLK